MHVPRVTVEGDAVLLRPMEAGDVDAVWEMVNDEEGRRFTGTHAEFTREQVAVWCASRPDAEDRIDWTVVERATGEVAGEVVLNDLDAANRSCGFRISLRSPAWFGRGLGSEATRLALAHAFGPLGLHRVSLEVYAFNERARRAYRSAGFQEEGVLRDALWWDGRFHDTVVMGALAPC